MTVQVLTDNINFETPSVLPFADSQNLSLTITGIVHTLIDETVSTAWYFNGAALRDGITIGSLKSPLLSISQTLEIENTNILDSGFYEVTLIIQPYTHLVSHLQCPTEYSDFVTDFVGIDNIVLARDVVQLVDSGENKCVTTLISIPVVFYNVVMHNVVPDVYTCYYDKQHTYVFPIWFLK